MSIFERNLAVIRRIQPEIAEKILKTQAGDAYKGIVLAKTGTPVPLFASGQALHSLYNPEREAERSFTASADFMLFCGLGCGIHIKVFLNNYPHAVCAVTEADYASFRQLLSLIDYTDLLACGRVFLLPPCTCSSFAASLAKTYLPVLHGTFGCHILRTWNEYFASQTEGLSKRIEKALERIKADFSVQVHFGKIWLRNIFSNLQLAASFRPEYPQTDTSRTALILGAGPGLEDTLTALDGQRRQYTLFCTDTALPVLLVYGIIPEFFVALDPQHISYRHTIGTIPQDTTGIFDLSAQSAVARRFLENGNHLFFTAGGHPLIQTAASFSPFPKLDTGSGTVAVAAYHAAQALGFKHIECCGMDFAYTGGKAYSRGTYLSSMFINSAERILPQEDSFIRLMFRTEVSSERTKTGLTYRSPLLDSYKAAFEAEKHSNIRWQSADFKQFPYKTFLTAFCRGIKKKETSMMTALLPFRAWETAHRNRNFTDMELVSELISGYTDL